MNTRSITLGTAVALLLGASAAVAQAGPACDQSYVGLYLQAGGKWQWYYQLDADCTGESCSQTLKNWDDPNSGYDWHCGRAKELKAGYGLKKIAKWQHIVMDGVEYIEATYEGGKVRHLELKRKNEYLLLDGAVWGDADDNVGVPAGRAGR